MIILVYCLSIRLSLYLANTMFFNIKNLISLILYIYNNLAANILVALIEKIIMMEKTMRITGSGMSN